MPRTDHPDPIADWFTRHRVKLALAVFVVAMLGRAPRLLEGPIGVVAFAHAAAFFGLLSWSWGSRQDRGETGYHLRFGTLWTILLAIQIGMVTYSMTRGNEFRAVWLVPMVGAGFFALAAWIPYRRIRSGKPWPPHAEDAEAQRSE